MATLLIETKVVKALQVQLEDVEALLQAVHKRSTFLIRPKRANVLVDVGRFVQQPLSNEQVTEYKAEMATKAGFPVYLTLPVAFQDLVNRGELPEGDYLLNLGPKQEHDGGQVKDYVLKVQAQIAEANAVAV